KLLTGDLTPQLWTPPADRVNGPSAVDWDVCFLGTNALVLSEFYERNASDATNNSTIPKDDKLDKMIAAMKSATNVEAQKKAFSDIQVYLNEQVYSMPMFYLPNWVVTSDKLDMKGNKPGADQFSYEKNILDWTINRADKTMYTNTGAVTQLEHTATNPGLAWHQEIVFDRLLNATGSLVPTDGLLAASYTVSPDGKTFEFTLRDGIKWHDGKPFTAEDVKWSLEYYPKVPGGNALMQTVLKDVKAITIDGLKVKVELNKVQPNATTVFAQWPILPKHLLEKVTPEKFSSDTFWQKPIGTGPFKVKEVKLNEYTILERNKDYFLPGTGNIELIHMFPSSDNGDKNLITNAKGGLIDYAFTKDATQVKQLREMAGYKVDTIDVTFPRYAFFNMFPREAKK
ncbi:MAG: ABC transporter substrate-binding protein, partial [Clostridia bacterium]